MEKSKRSSPRAILLDLDDTILDDEGTIPVCWRTVCADAARHYPGLDPEQLNAAIKQVGDWFWSDPERHRVGRLEPRAAGVRNVHNALISLGHDDPDLACTIYDAYGAVRQAAIQPLPGALETLAHLTERNIPLALITNGAGPRQRAKIARFNLARYFDFMLVEGEFGVGKPDERVYRAAMAALGSQPSDTWWSGLTSNGRLSFPSSLDWVRSGSIDWKSASTLVPTSPQTTLSGRWPNSPVSYRRWAEFPGLNRFCPPPSHRRSSRPHRASGCDKSDLIRVYSRGKFGLT